MEKYSDKIMIVDDSAPFLRLFAENLIDSDDSYILDHIILCENVDAALREYIIHKPLVVLMDIKMPGKNGIEGAQLLREIDPAARIFFLSNFPNDPEASKLVADRMAIGVMDKSLGTGVLAGMLGFVIKVVTKAI